MNDGFDHIREFDWGASSEQSDYFIDESALDNCNIEKILMNKFVDPLLSSDEEEEPPNVIDWDEVFKTKNIKRTPKLFVPGLRQVAPYPKVSALSESQHFKSLKVLCEMYPNVLEEMKIFRPTIMDRRNFDFLKEKYDKEKKEYIEWAKSLWVSHHCLRALRPKPVVETTYEAEFKVRAQRLSGYPKHFELAAQIPLESTRQYQYEATLKDTLVEVKVRDLPQIELPKLVKRISIIQQYSIPEPCDKHPYQFILPTESSVSVLPITEIHRELAEYAIDHGTRFIASENALRCLVEFNRHWTIPVTVCSTLNQGYVVDDTYLVWPAEGERCNVVVLDSEFSINKEPALVRTFKAFKHLLEKTLIPSSEIEAVSLGVQNNNSNGPKEMEEDLTSDDDEPLGLCIIEEFNTTNPQMVEATTTNNIMQDSNDHKHSDSSSQQIKSTACEDMSVDEINDVIGLYNCTWSANPQTEEATTTNNIMQDSNDHKHSDSSSQQIKSTACEDMYVDEINDFIGVYNCICADTLFERPPPRSYKKWQLLNKNTNESIDVIVHCPHKARLDSTEVVLEPSPEYQLELGASELPPDRLRGLALALLLRDRPSLVTVRVDGKTGEMVTVDTASAGAWLGAHAPARAQALNSLHTALAALEALLPGHYVLQHEPRHGANALLYVARTRACAGAGAGAGAMQQLQLDAAPAPATSLDEDAAAKLPPTISDALLPYHKYRKMLPCAFSPFPWHVAKDSKKPLAKQKTPPQAIRWPTRKNRNNKKRKNKNGKNRKNKNKKKYRQ